MQDDYFKDNYKHFTLCENDKKELYIYQPKLSSIKGFTNGYSNENVVSVYIPNEKKEIEEDYDYDDFYYEDEHNMLSDIQTIYLNDHILNLHSQLVDKKFEAKIVAPASTESPNDHADFIPMGRPVSIPSG